MFICIIVVLLVLLLLTSFAYSYLIIYNERQTQLRYADSEINRICNLSKEADDTEGVYCQIIDEVTDRENTFVHIYSEEGRTIAETSNFLILNFYAENENEFSYGFSRIGTIMFDDFKSSVSVSDYEEICRYLRIEPDSEGYYYSLLCTKSYIDSNDGMCYPKEVQIVKTKSDHVWYIQDEVIKTYNLNPKGKTTVLSVIPYKYRNEIDREFVFGNYEISDHVKSLKCTVNPTESDVGITYDMIYKFRINEYMNIWDARANYVGSDGSIMVYNETGARIMSYCKEINLLKLCKTQLFVGNGVILAIYLIAGIFIVGIVRYIFKKTFYGEEMRLEMTSALAHNLKNPLFIISGAAETMKELPEKASEYTEIVESQAKEMNRLVMQMLSNSKLSSGKYKPCKEEVNISALTEEILNSRRDKDIKISLDSDGEIKLFCDRELTRLALENLIENACKYTLDSNVSILIDKKQFTISNKSSDMSKSELKKIWKTYYRGNAPGKYGTGLGLSVVSEVLRLHKMSYKCTLNDGVFSVIIRL